VIREFHHPRNGRIERQFINVVRYCLDRLMKDAILVGGRLAIDYSRVKLHGLGSLIQDEPPQRGSKSRRRR